MSRKNSALGSKLPVTRVSESRKVRKPLMEKKRRARINQSLNDLKRLLLESNSVKKEGARPTKLEKADILELTVNHVQKLHQQHHQSTFNTDTDAGVGTRSPILMDETAKFKAGFSECARLVRDVLQSQMDSTGLDHRTNKHLERCLANLDRALMMHQSVRSPSPLHSSSESCSSFEGKDTVLLSPQSTTDRSSPVDHALLWSSKATAFTPPDQHIGGRRCRSSSSHDVQSPSFPYSPDSSPVVADQHSSDCSMFMSTPSSALTATAAVSSAVEGRNIINNKSSGKWQQQRQVVTSPFQQHQQHSEWQMSDAHVMELRPCGRSSVKASSLVSFPLFTCSKTGTEDPTGRVWRPW